MQVMLAGGLDVAYMRAAPPIIAISQGPDAKIVDGVNVLGSNLVLRRSLNYRGPKSLQGLTIATNPLGSIQDLALRKWLKDNGICDKKLETSTMATGDAATALDAGTIDGFLMPHPNPAIVDMGGQGKYAVALGRMWPDHACCSVLVSGTLIRDRPDLVKKSAKIHTKATNYINHHFEEAARIYSNRAGHYVELVKYAIITWDDRWISNPSLQVPSAVDFNLNCIDRVLTEDDLFDASFYDGFA